MSTAANLLTVSLFLLLSLNAARCDELDGKLEKLQRLLASSKLSRRSRDSEDASLIWQEYEFGTGVGNREELLVENITVREVPGLPSDDARWEFLDGRGAGYLAGVRELGVLMYKINFPSGAIEARVDLNVTGRVLAFRLINLLDSASAESEVDDVVMILCVESDRGTELRWYRLLANEFDHFWSWPVQKYVDDMEWIREGGQYKLLLLNNDGAPYLGKRYSPIDVYGFSIDFVARSFDFWLCQRIIVPRVFDIQVCPIRESTMLVLQGLDMVSLYEYRNDATVECHLFEHFQELTSSKLRNFVCFDSGYIQYLAISGPEAGLYEFAENEFQYNTGCETFFAEIAEVACVKDVRVDTYRDESLLLVQLRNSTVIALSWQGSDFKRTHLPTGVLDGFDLSRITVVPRYGFVAGNKLVRIEVKLRQLERPAHDKTKKMMSTRSLLEEILRRQESVLNETETRYRESYRSNPVITGFWNMSTVTVENATINDSVVYHSVSVGSRNLTAEDVQSNATSLSGKLNGLQRKLNEIERNLKDSVDASASQLDLDSIEIIGNLNITGSLNSRRFNASFINGARTVNAANDFANYSVVEGRKIFPSIESDRLLLLAVNGVPIENILLGPPGKNYGNVDLSKTRRIVIDGHLGFSSVNGVDWMDLMESVVWRNKTDCCDRVVPGETVVEGTITANDLQVDYLNNLSYPRDYVSVRDDEFTTIVGTKSFEHLTVAEISGLKTINDIDIDDFITIDEQRQLRHEITFENLAVGNIQIDGNISGIDLGKYGPQPGLNESRNVRCDVIFSSLTVLGNILLEESVNGDRWSGFDDLLLKTDENALITGKKRFLREVHLGSPTVIKSGLINHRRIDEFVTTDTEQVFPNLQKVSANITIVNSTLGAVEKLEELLNGSKECLNRMIVFTAPQIVDELTFDMINGVSSDNFADKLNETFRNVRFENLSVEKMIADEIVPKVLNGMNFTELKNFRAPFSMFQNLTGDYTIDNLRVENLIADRVNGIPIEEFLAQSTRADSLIRNIFTGNVSIESLKVSGSITAPSINNKDLREIYDPDTMGTMIFRKNVSVENLTVLGFVNGLNFSELATDAIMKTDTNIVVTGYKRFENINCNFLNTISLNGHPVENALDLDREQVLLGPVFVNGTVNVLNNFDCTENVNDIPFRNLTDRFKYLGNDTFELHGDFRFPSNVSISHLNVSGSVQGTNLDDFFENLIFKNSENVTVLGSKVFEGSVVFKQPLVIEETLNELDLALFYEKAVFIDRPFSIQTECTFLEDVEIEKSLTVTEDLDANSIVGVDLNELQNSVMYVNRPTFVEDSITFTNVELMSDVEVEKLNDKDLNFLIPLRTDQTIAANPVRGYSITAKHIEIDGNINGRDLEEIYRDTLMTIGNQTITGNFYFSRGVSARADFNTNLINGINPKQLIDLNTNDTLTGDFAFTSPVYVGKNLRILGYLNGIDPLGWQAIAVTSAFPLKQIIAGNWTVHGNVTLRNGAVGEGFLDGINVTEFANALERQRLLTDAFVSDARMDLNVVCQDANYLREHAANQIYKFHTFDRVQSMESLDSVIVGVHHFELDGHDRLLVSYESCHLVVYKFAGSRFFYEDTLENFGTVDRWVTLKRENVTYLLALGRPGCGKSSGNLWKIENGQFTHLLDLGNASDARKLNDDTFLVLKEKNLIKTSIEEIRAGSEISETVFVGSDNLRFVVGSERILLADRYSIYEYAENLIAESWPNSFECSTIFAFTAGIFQREMFLYYDEKLTEDYIFITDENMEQKRVLQTIETHKAKSFLAMNFDGLVETLLVFVENDRNLQIFEYKGVQGFVYRDTIKMRADKLLSFRVRTNANFARKQFLAVVDGNRLTILKAIMHGEKLDVDACSLH